MQVSRHRGQGESLVPLYTRESVSLSLSGVPTVIKLSCNLNECKTLISGMRHQPSARRGAAADGGAGGAGGGGSGPGAATGGLPPLGRATNTSYSSAVTSGAGN